MDLNRLLFLQEFIKQYQPFGGKIAIAGGCIADLLNNQHPKDIDIFCDSQETVDDLVSSLRKKHRPLHETDKLVDFAVDGYVYQVVKNKVYQDLSSELVNTFDFNICRAVVTEDMLHFTKKFVLDFSTKQLTVHKIFFAAHTEQRLERYIQKGYKPSQQCLDEIKKAKENPNQGNYYNDQNNISINSNNLEDLLF